MLLLFKLQRTLKRFLCKLWNTLQNNFINFVLRLWIISCQKISLDHQLTRFVVPQRLAENGFVQIMQTNILKSRNPTIKAIPARWIHKRYGLYKRYIYYLHMYWIFYVETNQKINYSFFIIWVKHDKKLYPSAPRITMPIIYRRKYLTVSSMFLSFVILCSLRH